MTDRGAVNEPQHLSFLQQLLRRRPIRRAVRAGIERPAQSVVGLVFLTLAAGTIFYHVVEGWSLLDSVYFCVITLTTIGYGDFAPTTNLARLFTIFYAFTGIGLLATFIQLRAQQRLGHRFASGVESELEAIGKEASSLEHKVEDYDEVLPFDPLP